MSLTSDSHHLLFKDYKFPLEDRSFLDKLAFNHYEGVAKSKRVIDALHDMLRTLVAYSVQVRYGLSVTPVAVPGPATVTQVSERADLVGQDDKIYLSINMINGAEYLPAYLQPKKAEEGKEPEKAPEYISNPVKLIDAVEHVFAAERHHEWFLKDGRTFQVATLLYELRRVVLDLPFGFHGHVWKDNHGVAHFYVTQAVAPEFADERLNVYFSIVLPSVFNGKVIEQEKALAKAEA